MWSFRPGAGAFRCCQESERFRENHQVTGSRTVQREIGTEEDIYLHGAIRQNPQQFGLPYVTISEGARLPLSCVDLLESLGSPYLM